MKTSFKIIYTVILIFAYHTIFSGGFVNGTLVNANNQFICIEDLNSNDYVTSYHTEHRLKNYPITHISYYISDNYIQIYINNTYILAAPDQKFYSPSKSEWIEAQKLKPYSLLLCYDNSIVFIKKIKRIYQPVRIYSLTVDHSHTFCVSSYNILAHNCEPGTLAATTVISLAFPPAAPVILGLQVAIGTIFATVGCYHAYKHHQKQKTFAQIAEEVKINSCSNGNPQDPNDDDEDNAEENNEKPNQVKNRTLNTIAKSEFFKRISNYYKNWKQGIYKRIRGQKGIEDAEYLEWDHTHGDVEAYDRARNHIGSINPKH